MPMTNVNLPLVKITRSTFLSSPHARRYMDVINDPNIPFNQWCTFFSDPLRQKRLVDSEIHHRRPALGGVVIELENDPNFIILKKDRNHTRRYRQAIGLLTKQVMIGLGFKTTGRKGFLGGGRKNSLSKYFSKAEHYEKI